MHARNLLCFLLLLLGCATSNVSPGMTLLVGLNHYQAEMTRLESRPDRWFDRQRLGESLKAAYLVTMGGSREFSRLVDLDVRKREFLIALRETSLRPERVKEIREELVIIDQNITELKRVIKEQLASFELRSQGQAENVETVAAIGLLHLALDGFSTNEKGTVGLPERGLSSSPKVNVGQYLVTDHGKLTTVSTPEGQTYRCSPILLPDEGASIRCEAPATK
jgi:hypothetical protein